VSGRDRPGPSGRLRRRLARHRLRHRLPVRRPRACRRLFQRSLAGGQADSKDRTATESRLGRGGSPVRFGNLPHDGQSEIPSLAAFVRPAHGRSGRRCAPDSPGPPPGGLRLEQEHRRRVPGRPRRTAASARPASVRAPSAVPTGSRRDPAEPAPAGWPTRAAADLRCQDAEGLPRLQSVLAVATAR
jgi:hypothetical protein